MTPLSCHAAARRAANHTPMKVTYYGQSCLGVEAAGKNLLFDPFIRQNELAKDVNVDAIPADYILITHGHFDHVADAAEIAKRTGALVISTPEVCAWLKKQGVEHLCGMAQGGATRLDFGRVKMVAAVHGSRMPDDTDGGFPAGFVLETVSGNFYHAGDTALTMDMQLIGQSTRLDWAALPIGDHYTMGVDDAIRAADFIGCSRILGIHYDTFPPIRVDRDEARLRFTAAGKELVLIGIGSTLDL